MTMTFESFQNDYLMLFIFILIGYIVREFVKPLQKFYIPSSIVGGIVALILGQQVLGIVTIPESFSSVFTITSSIIMASMIFGVSINKESIKGYFDFTSLNMISYGVQLAILTGVGILLTSIWTNLPTGWGTMGLFAFWGGHPVASIAGGVYQELGVEENMAIGMIMATFGLIIAMTIGMGLVNWGIRKGYAKNLSDDLDENLRPRTGGLLPEDQQDSIGNEKVPAVGISHLALQFSFLALAIFIGIYGINLIGRYIPALTKLPNTTRGMIGAAIVWAIMVKTKTDKYADVKTIKSIASFVLEITVLAAIATLRLDILASFLVPILILTGVNIAIMLFISLVIAPRIAKTDWFEKMLINFGQTTGDSNTGLALLRCADPRLKSSAAESFGVASALTIPITGTFPALIPVIAMQSQSIVFAVGVVILLVFLAICRLFFWNRSPLGKVSKDR